MPSMDHHNSSDYKDSNYGNYGHRETGGFGAELNSIDLVQLFLVIRRRIGLIIACTILLTGAAIFYATTLPKEFTSTAQLEIQPPRRSVLAMQDMDTRFGDDGAFMSTQIEILRSREIHTQLVKKLGLMTDPEFNPAYAEREKIFQESGLRSPAGSDRDVTWTEAELQSVVGRVMDMTDAAQIGKSNIVSISATSVSPQLAAKIADELINVYLMDNTRKRLSSYQSTSEWLNEEIEQVQDKLAKAESEAEAYRAKYKLGDALGNSYTDQQITDLNGMIVTARADAAQAKARYRRLENIIETGASGDTIAEALSSPVIQNLRESKADLIRDRAELSSKYDVLHPAIQEVNAKIGDLNAQIREEVNRISASMENEVEVAESRVRSLEASLEELQGSDAENDQARITLNQLELEVLANRKLLDNLLESYKQSAVLSSNKSLEPVAQRVSQATVPQMPSSPRMRMIAIFAFAASSALGVGLAFFLEAIDQGISTGKEVEDRLGVAHLASIPANKGIFNMSGLKNRSIHDQILDRPLSQFAEAFRSLRSNLVLTNVENPPQVVLVTSSLAQEGKTTASICLARTAAKSGIKTLLIDADFRNPSVGERLDIHTQAGFVEVLAQKCDLDMCIFADHRSPLDILPISKAVFAQPDLLNSETVGAFFNHVRTLYDFIVVDGAPVLPVSDSTILSRRADATIFTVKWETTPRRAVESGINKLLQARANNLGVILSQVNLERLKAYGYGDDLYYAGQYGHAMDKMRKSWFKRKNPISALFGGGKAKYDDGHSVGLNDNMPEAEQDVFEYEQEFDTEETENRKAQ